MDEVREYTDQSEDLVKRADAARMRLVAVEIEAAAALLTRAERAPDTKQRVALLKEARATVSFASRFAMPEGEPASRLEELRVRLEELSAMYLNPLARTPPHLRGHKYLK